MKKLLLLLTIISHFAFGQNASSKYDAIAKKSYLQTGVAPKANVVEYTDTASGKSPIWTIKTPRIKIPNVNSTASTDTAKFDNILVTKGDSLTKVSKKSFISEYGTNRLKGDILRTGNGESYFGTINGGKLSWVDTYVDDSTRIQESIVLTPSNSFAGTFMRSKHNVATWNASTQGLFGDKNFSFSLDQPYMFQGSLIKGDSVYRTNDSLRYIQLGDADDRYAPIGGGGSGIDTLKVGRIEQGRGSVPATLSFDGVKWYMNDTSYIPRSGASNITGNLKRIGSSFRVGLNSDNSYIDFGDYNTQIITQGGVSGANIQIGSGASSSVSLNVGSGSVAFTVNSDSPTRLNNQYLTSNEVYRTNDSLRYIQLKDAQERFAPISGTQSTTLADGKIWIGDGTDTAFPRTLSGDVTVDNLGVTTISDSVVTSQKLASQTSIGFLSQSTPTSPYANGVNGIKLSANSNALTINQRSGIYSFTTRQSDFENIVGDLVNDNFDRTTSGYRLGGSNISQAIVSNQLVITNTTGNAGVWNNFITNDSIVWSDEYDYSVQLVGSTNGAGLGLGLRVDGYIGMGIRLDMSSSGTRGLLYLVNINPGGTETILQTSTVALSYANGDSIRLGYRMDGYMVTPYVQKNGGSPISMVINANLTSTEQSFRMAEEKMYVFSFGGVQNLTNLNFKINSRKNADLALVADSRFYGYNSGPGMTNERVCSQLIGNIVAKGNYVNYSVSGGRMSQLASELGVLIKLKPKIALISLGINDAGNGLSNSAFQAYLTSIVNALSQCKIKVAVTTIVGGTDAATDTLVAAYNTSLRARKDIILLDVSPTMMTSGAIKTTMTTDGIHYNELGHYTFFQYIKDNFNYKSPLQYPFSVTKTSSSNLIGAFPSLTLTNANPTQENGTTNNNISSISLNSGNNSVSGFITSSYNSGGLGSQLSIGTSTSSPVALYSNNVKRVNISTIGEVGVNGIMYVGGLSAPNAYLQLSAGTAGFPAFSLTSQTAYTGGVVGTLCLENTNNFSFIGNLTMKQGAASNVGTSDNQYLNIIQNNTARLALTSSTLFFQDGYNIALGTTTGTIIGMSPTQKLAFYGGTAIVQPLATTDLGTVLSNLNLRGVGAAYPITTSGAVTMSGTVALTGGILTGAATQNVFNLGSTTIGAFGGATGLYLGGGASGSVSHYYSYAATTSGQTKLIEIGTNGLSGSTTNIAIGSAVSGATGTTTINSPLVLKNYTVATLPAGSTGMRATVTDALTPVYDANVVGGGARVIEVIFNGTNWTCH